MTRRERRMVARGLGWTSFLPATRLASILHRDSARTCLASTARAYLCLISDFPHTMKPPMQEELEDDLAAEEENKLINEVLQPVAS